MLVSEFLDTIQGFAANLDLQVLPGNKVTEIRNAGVDKGAAGLEWMANRHYDFILAVGDDWTDEDLFSVLPSTAFSIKVGLSRAYGSRALYSTQSYEEVLELLRGLTESELEPR